MTDWIVAHCHANGEFKAESHLRRQGYEVYLPKCKKNRRHARRVETVIRPLFPRYLFIAFDEELTPWRAIRSTVGIGHLITADEYPLIAPSWIVDQLRTREDDSGLLSENAENSFRKGDAIQITSGPFIDHLGSFERLSDAQRIAVLLDIMGRQVKTLVPHEAIRRAS